MTFSNKDSERKILFSWTFFFVCLVSVGLLNGCSDRNDRKGNSAGATFYVDSVTSQITPFNLNSLDMVDRKMINFNVCVKDNAMSSAIQGMKFSVAADGATSSPRMTDDRGCFQWQELFQFTPADDEKLVTMNRRITAVTGHQGFEDVELSFNPWLDKMYFTKRDGPQRSQKDLLSSQNLNPEMLRTLGLEANSSFRFDFFTEMKSVGASFNNNRTDITSLSLKFIERDFSNYRVSEALNLTIAHKYRMKFNSALIRRTLNSGTIAYNVGSGRFRFHFVLLRDGFGKNTPKEKVLDYVVSATEFTADAYLGRIVQDITLSFDDVKAMSSRMTGLLTISPVSSSLFQEGSFEGPVTPIASGSAQGIDLVPSVWSAKELFKSYRQAQAEKKSRKPLELFAATSDYKNVDLNPVPFPGSGTGISRTAAFQFDITTGLRKISRGENLSKEESHQWAAAACYKFFTGLMDAGVPEFKTLYNQCQSDPEKMMISSVRDFVTEVHNSQPRQVGIPLVESISMGTALDFTEMRSQSNGNTNSRRHGYSFSTEVGISPSFSKVLFAWLPFKLNLGLGYKLSSGKETFATVGVATNDNQSTRIGTGRSVQIFSEGLKFSMDLSTKSCWLLAPSPLFAEQIKSTLGKLNEKRPAQNKIQWPVGRFACDNEVRRGIRDETYYFINQSTGLTTSPLSDNMSAEDNPWRMFIRGKDTYALFAELFSQKDYKLVFEKLPDEEIRKDFQEYYLTQEFPGVLSPSH